MYFSDYSAAHQYLSDQVPQSQHTAFPGDHGWRRTGFLLSKLEDPQEQPQVIHVAGTSGKGSVAQMVYRMLLAAGKTVGLTVSPHIISVRERVQINGYWISKQQFVAYMNQVVPVIEACRATEFGDPTYFDVCICLAFTAFAREGCQYAVVETGLGGLLDGTNWVNRSDKLCLLTPIGFDHMHVLGDTIPEIAAQKAGIIRTGNTVFAIDQFPEAVSVFRTKAQEKQATFTALTPSSIITSIEHTADGERFSISYPGESERSESAADLSDVYLPLHGQHQVENAVLAIAAVRKLLQEVPAADLAECIKAGLSQVQLPGRFTVVNDANGCIIADVAHNTQKMESFLKSLSQYKPKQRFPFLLAFKQGKDWQSMIDMIIPYASHLILTSFENRDNDVIHHSVSPDQIADYLQATYQGKISLQVQPMVTEAYKSLGTSEGVRVITGSLYLIGVLVQLGLLRLPAGNRSGTVGHLDLH